MSRHILLKNFEGFTRIRVGAILIEKNSVLLVKQASLFDTTLSNWLPPGGGLLFRESLEDAVQRECLEETGLRVRPIKLLYINEFIHDQVHAVEFFFLVERADQKEAVLGTDPELSEADQIIQDILWIPLDDLKKFQVIPDKLFNRIADDYLKGFVEHPLLIK